MRMRAPMLRLISERGPCRPRVPYLVIHNIVINHQVFINIRFKNSKRSLRLD